MSGRRPRTSKPSQAAISAKGNGHVGHHPSKAGPNVQANGGGTTIEFKPVGRDAFMIGQMLIRSARDRSGEPTGLEYTNPLLRKVKFAASVN